MKRLFAIILSVILCVTLCACEGMFAEPTPTPAPTPEPTATPAPFQMQDPLVGTAIMENLSEEGVNAFIALEMLEAAYSSYRMANLAQADTSEFVEQGKSALNSFNEILSTLSEEEQTVLGDYLNKISTENNMDLSVFEADTESAE